MRNSCEAPERLKTIATLTEWRLKRDYPQLTYSQLVVVPTGSRIIINDVSVYGAEPVSVARMISKLSAEYPGEAYVYDIAQLATRLQDQLQCLRVQLGERQYRCIFPGQSAEHVRYRLCQNLVSGGSNPDITVVIDDIVSTGLTLSRARQTLPTGGETIAMPLMMRSPLQNEGNSQNRSPLKEGSGIKGYDKIITPIVYQGELSPPEVTRLSSMLPKKMGGTVSILN
jgi:hypothetical protein